ncbi:hypothetical protein HU200_045891 [Digitaria exilis]|uniref:Uncharacterized protein n=1 Tax=Digitaria exilis TaxID=1010633 RepID=A0A835EF79_9POAL|nr:hypothetical protein HU200_045891 [Digitaria exilis]
MAPYRTAEELTTRSTLAKRASPDLGGAADGGGDGKPTRPSPAFRGRETRKQADQKAANPRHPSSNPTRRTTNSDPNGGDAYLLASSGGWPLASDEAETKRSARGEAEQQRGETREQIEGLLSFQNRRPDIDEITPYSLAARSTGSSWCSPCSPPQIKRLITMASMASVRHRAERREIMASSLFLVREIGANDYNHPLLPKQDAE